MLDLPDDKKPVWDVGSYPYAIVSLSEGQEPQVLIIFSQSEVDQRDIGECTTDQGS